MLKVKVKAVLILSLLIIAIGVPTILYSLSVSSNVNKSPVAVMYFPSRAYVNTPVEFSGNMSKDDGFIVSYLWDFGDGHKSSGKYVNHTYLSVGNYTVTLTVCDNDGVTNSTTKKIEIEEYEERVPIADVEDILSEPGKYIGQKIRVRGVFGYGRNYSFYMVNESGYRGLRVYCEQGAKRPNSMSYGDEIEVQGRFTVYRGELELKVENDTTDYVIITGHGGENGYADISMSDWGKYNNSFVHLLGNVTNVTRSYKFEMGALTIYEEFNATTIGTPAIGDSFEVWGFLTYYKPRNYSGYNEIVIRAFTDDMSKYIKSIYKNTTVSRILSEPDKYNNTAVEIDKAVVVEEYAFWKFWVSDENSSEKIQVYVEKGGNIQGMIFSGAKLKLFGTLSYYKGTWEIKIRNETDDRIIVLNRPTYTDVSVPELLRNSSMYENKSVHTWGVVSWFYHNTSSGLILFGIYYEGEELTAVGFNGSDISNIVEGYWVDAYGLFTSYQGEWEIKIEPNSYDYAVGKPQNYTDVNITKVMGDPLYYNNTLVHIPWAVVTYVYDASWLFYVSNSTGNSEDISVYVEKGGLINGTVYKCAPVEIWGMVTYYSPKQVWEIKIRNSTEDMVDVLKKFTYVDVNITDLLNNVSEYNDTNVHIPNATVIDVYAPWLFWISNSTNNSANITVYVEHGAHSPLVGKGDILEIYGNVTLHNGTYEIKIRNCTPDQIIVLHSNVKYVNMSYIHEVKSDGTLVHLGEQVVVNGTVISNISAFSYTSNSGTKLLKFYIEDSTGGVLVLGIGLDYSSLNLTDGDVVQVRGTIDQYNGEAELRIVSLDYITYLNHTLPLKPLNLTTGYFSNWNNAEKVEGMLVHVNGTVKSINTQYHYIYIDDGSGQVEIYFKSAFVDMSNISVGDNLSVTGIVSQYDKTSPYTSYYEILPRYRSDVVKVTSKKSEESSTQYEKIETNHELFGIPIEVIMWKRNTVLTAEDMLAH